MVELELDSFIRLAAVAVPLASFVLAAVALLARRRRNRRTASREDFRRVLSRVPEQHAFLVEAARHCYHTMRTVPGSWLLTQDDWLPQTPTSDEHVRLTWIRDVPALVTGDHPTVRSRLPKLDTGEPFTRYSQAIGDLAKPTLFVNRFCYRLLDVRLSEDPELIFGETWFFETLDIEQPLILETADLTQDESEPRSAGRKLRSRRARLRRLLGYPFDLARRPHYGGLETLTLRVENGKADFYMHSRSMGQVAVSGGLISVVPTAIFQPAAVDNAHARQRDFNLWHNTVREFAEEFLGAEEAAGDRAVTLDNDNDPLYASFMRAKRDEQVRHWLLGAGIDPLTLSPKLLTAAVFDAEAFDRLFLGMVEENSEGLVVRAGRHERAIPGLSFDSKMVEEYCMDRRITPGSAACLRLAWEHRDFLLA